MFISKIIVKLIFFYSTNQTICCKNCSVKRHGAIKSYLISKDLTINLCDNKRCIKIHNKYSLSTVIYNRYVRIIMTLKLIFLKKVLLNTLLLYSILHVQKIYADLKQKKDIYFIRI